MNLERLFGRFGLRPRRGPFGRASGVFRYPGAHTSLCFIWDAAAIDVDGSVVLIEEELGPIITAHIQSHIARIPVMAALGERISRLIWVVREDSFPRLREIADSWRTVEETSSNWTLPPMTYVDPNEYVLFEERSPGELDKRRC